MGLVFSFCFEVVGVDVGMYFWVEGVLYFMLEFVFFLFFSLVFEVVEGWRCVWFGLRGEGLLGWSIGEWGSFG